MCWKYPWIKCNVVWWNTKVHTNCNFFPPTETPSWDDNKIKDTPVSVLRQFCSSSYILDSMVLVPAPHMGKTNLLILHSSLCPTGISRYFKTDQNMNGRHVISCLPSPIIYSLSIYICITVSCAHTKISQILCGTAQIACIFILFSGFPAI